VKEDANSGSDLSQSKEDKTNREMMADLLNEILSLCEFIQKSFFWVTLAKGFVHGCLLSTSEWSGPSSPEKLGIWEEAFAAVE